MSRKLVIMAAAFLSAAAAALGQTYPQGLIDKTVAVVGNEMISVSQIEGEIRQRSAGGYVSDPNMRCEILEAMLESKVFLMQARIDSLTVKQDMVSTQLDQQIDYLKSRLGGEDEMEAYFGKPIYKLRQMWKQQLEESSLAEQKRSEVASDVPELTPYDVRQYIASTDSSDLPIIPIKYQLSQICIYPDREAAALAVKEKLLGLRERILAGEKFSTLARIYSEDTGSARRGGELGMSSKSIFWAPFSDAAMSLRPGVISNIVETPDGFHIIEVIEKRGDMFNARHILMKPQYTAEDREKAFKTLDSLRTEILNGAVTFQLAARFYSEDAASRTNGGQMADPQTGSSYFEIDRLKPQDYRAIRDLEVGEISGPIESLDNEGRTDNPDGTPGGNTVYKILRVDNIIPAHAARLETDFDQLSNYAQNEKARAAIDKFLEEKIRTTTITIDPIFKDCDFAREAWKSVAAKSAQ